MTSSKDDVAESTEPHGDLETVVLSNDPRFLELIERSRARQEQEGGIPAEEIRRLFEAE